MFTITYTRLYYGRPDVDAIPPDRLRVMAERAAPMLHPERTHVYSTSEPTFPAFLIGIAIPGSIGWIVTFTPNNGWLVEAPSSSAPDPLSPAEVLREGRY